MIHYSKLKPFPFTLVLLFTLINAALFTAHAQTESRPEEKKAAVQLSPEQWKAVEGYYQNARNKDMYIQLTAKGNYLQEKLLWNNNELRLTPESELDFTGESEGEQVHINFIKDSSGNIAQLLFNKNNVFIRAKDYKPVVKVEMLHTPAQLRPYEGIYQLQRDKERFIQFSEKDNKLVLKQHWDGKEVAFMPETDTSFFSKEVPLFSLIFVKGGGGSITRALVNKRDNWEKLIKVIPTPEQFKALEGKYQFKDDPDNNIQLIAKGNNLIVKQLWDKTEIVLEPCTPTYFYCKEQSYPLQVTTDGNGAVTQILVLGMDVFIKVK